MELLQQHDQRVIALIYEHYAHALFNVIYRILRDEAMAQDVFQEAIIKVWRKGHFYERSKGSLFTWLMSVCKHAAIDKTRSKAYKQRQKTASASKLVHTSDEPRSPSTARQQHLSEVVSRLPEHQKVLIELSYFQGYTHEEIAQRLEMPLGTVKTRTRAAIKQLRKLIEL